jgi:hypothetical protein
MLHTARLIALALALTAVSGAAKAGPPFLTDDPEPVPYRHSEFYVFGTRDKAVDSDTIQGPSMEFNYGVRPEMQFHVVIPYVNVFAAGAPTQRGLGDTELGIKYRFVREAGSHPQVGVFPMVELPTGDSDKQLGNGRAWYRLPVWLQKSWGPWTTYGGGGYAINTAPGMRNYWFGGGLLQRQVSDRLTLGGELFAQGPNADEATSTTMGNVGGYWNFTPDFSLLFSAGHSVSGERHSIAYLGLYWTWGHE